MKKVEISLSIEEKTFMLKNLRISACSNCGTDEAKQCVGKFEYIKLDIEDETFGLEDVTAFPVVVFCCPKCGLLSSFNYKMICR